MLANNQEHSTSTAHAMGDTARGMLRVLALGDVCGEAGVKTITRAMPILRESYKPDLVVVNIENIGDGGRGVTRESFQAVQDIGIDVFSTGNHIWDFETDLSLFEEDERLLRPINYANKLPGKGSHIVTTSKGIRVGVINVQGLHHMASIGNPFDAIEQELIRMKDDVDLVVVDCHAELAEEKAALAFAFDGKISALWGTHTHIPTADERILPQGTGLLSDLGICGGVDGVIGFDGATSLDHAITHLPRRNEIVKKGRLVASGALFSIDITTARCVAIDPVALDVSFRSVS